MRGGAEQPTCCAAHLLFVGGDVSLALARANWRSTQNHVNAYADEDKSEDALHESF